MVRLDKAEVQRRNAQSARDRAAKTRRPVRNVRPGKKVNKYTRFDKMEQKAKKQFVPPNFNIRMNTILNDRNKNYLTIKATEVQGFVAVAPTTQTKYSWLAMRPHTFRGLRMYVGEYANFRFTSIRYRYRPDVTVINSGQVAMGYSEANMTFSSNYHALSAMKATHFGQAAIPGEWKELLQHKHIRENWLFNASDTVTTKNSAGFFFSFGWGNTPEAALGHLEWTYTVQFDNRILAGIHTAGVDPLYEMDLDKNFGGIIPNSILDGPNNTETFEVVNSVPIIED